VFVLTVAVVAGLLLLVPGVRNWLGEQARRISDFFVSGFLRFTSQFGQDLNREGREEQEMWRSQRLRYFRTFDREDSEP
jgi:hypothetical protein